MSKIQIRADLDNGADFEKERMQVEVDLVIPQSAAMPISSNPADVRRKNK